MAAFKQSSPPSNHEVEITLGLLNAVHENDKLTQRTVAQELGIALGLANAYLKRCVKKGYVKVQQIPKNRYAYYLTPQGFAEKSRLTAEYLSFSFVFFRSARAQCDEIFAHCAEQGWRTIVLVGGGDLCEIAILCGREFPITFIGVVDSDCDADTFSGLAVLKEINVLSTADAAMITDLQEPQVAFDTAIEVLPRERVLAPKLLKVSQQPPRLEEEEAS